MNYKILAVVLAVALVAGILVLPGMFAPSTAELDTSDDGLSAAISFRPKVAAQASLTSENQYPSADALAQENPWFSLKETLPSYSVTDKATGADVSATEMVIKLNGKVITAGVPVSQWTMTGTVSVKIDGSNYKSYSFSTTGEGNPPSVISIPFGSSPEVSIPVSNMEQAWGKYAYGEHTVQISGAANVHVRFADNEERTKEITASDLGSVVFVTASDAAIQAVEVTSNYDATGTTTETVPNTGSSSGDTTTQVKVTDTWASVRGDSVGLDKTDVLVMKISDPARHGMKLTEITILTYGEGGRAGTVQAYLATSTNALIANSVENYPVSQVNGYVKFTFPTDTVTPNGEFLIGIKNIGGNDVRTLVEASTSNPYSGGQLVIYRNGAPATNYATPNYDLIGSATYVQ